VTNDFEKESHGGFKKAGGVLATLSPWARSGLAHQHTVAAVQQTFAQQRVLALRNVPLFRPIACSARVTSVKTSRRSPAGGTTRTQNLTANHHGLHLQVLYTHQSGNGTSTYGPSPLLLGNACIEIDFQWSEFRDAATASPCFANTIRTSHCSQGSASTAAELQ
jgi:hypothetical protein